MTNIKDEYQIMPEKKDDLTAIGENSGSTARTDKFGLECYGAKINVTTDERQLRAKLREYLPFVKQEEYFENISDTVFFTGSREEGEKGMYFNGEPAMHIEEISDKLFEAAADKILMIMAAVSLPSKIYLHAGAVVWRELGILIPGTSCAGKTTLVKEFIKAGADYYSDDCIILDERCNMLPFPRALSIRTEKGKVYRDANYFGAKNGIEKKRVDLILFSQYRENAVWKPRKLSRGESVLKLMDNFYYRSSVGAAPSEIFGTMANLTERAASFGGERGEASRLTDWVWREFLSR